MKRNVRARYLSIITYIVLCVALIFSFNKLWPDHKVFTTIIPLVVGGLITHFIRKLFDFIYDSYNQDSEETILGVTFNIEGASRNFVGYGASNGEIIQAGNFKANYEVKAEINVIIQNESPTTIYGVEVSFTPNDYSKQYTLLDTRQNRLEPLEGNKHFEYKLRIVHYYYDVYAQDADKDIHKLYKLGKDVSLLNGAKINISYRDSRHKERSQTVVIA